MFQPHFFAKCPWFFFRVLAECNIQTSLYTKSIFLILEANWNIIWDIILLNTPNRTKIPLSSISIRKKVDDQQIRRKIGFHDGDLQRRDVTSSLFNHSSSSNLALLISIFDSQVWTTKKSLDMNKTENAIFNPTLPAHSIRLNLLITSIIARQCQPLLILSIANDKQC